MIYFNIVYNCFSFYLYEMGMSYVFHKMDLGV